VPTGLAYAVGANWSPDGTKLAFTGPGRKGYANDLYVINVDGSRFTRLTATGVNEADPVWSPDGTALVFSRNNVAGFKIGLWKMVLATKKVKRIKTKFPRAWGADWQPIP
jgi:Tol biopolymer transport system component